MHASIEQLLNLRDQLLHDAELKQHVDSCELCQKSLQDLSNTREQLNQIADLPPATNPVSEEAWNKISQRAALEKSKAKEKMAAQKRKLYWMGGITVAASFVFAVSIMNDVVVDESVETTSNQIAIVSTVQQVKKSNLEESLIQRNLYFEQALRELPEPNVVRGGTAATIASLENQIALVDYGLSYAHTSGSDDSRSLNLLKNRADLMASLYQVRYSQAVASLSY